MRPSPHGPSASRRNPSLPPKRHPRQPAQPPPTQYTTSASSSTQQLSEWNECVKISIRYNIICEAPFENQCRSNRTIGRMSDSVDFIRNFLNDATSDVPLSLDLHNALRFARLQQQVDLESAFRLVCPSAVGRGRIDQRIFEVQKRQELPIMIHDDSGRNPSILINRAFEFAANFLIRVLLPIRRLPRHVTREDTRFPQRASKFSRMSVLPKKLSI